MPRYSFVPPGGGPNYDWAKDHTFVKVSAGDTGGAFTLMEDNLKVEFSLGLHLHRYHSETFYILEGAVDFYIDGDWMTAETGSTIYIPPGIEHALDMPDGRTGKLLMIMQPSGFDEFLSVMATMTEEDFADEARMTALNEKYDIFNIGPVPPRG
jgi:quercetin dioxygenase-like cupin family protein